MAFHPLHFLQLQQMYENFRHRHPKLPLFFQAAAKDALMEGTIVELTVKAPDGKAYCTNLKLNQADVEMIQAIRQLKEQQ